MKINIKKNLRNIIGILIFENLCEDLTAYVLGMRNGR